MWRPYPTMIVAVCLLWPGAVAAATVEVNGDEPRKSISVSVENAPLAAVLEALRERYEFKITGLENAARGQPVTVTMSGSLHAVLARLLRNRNYVIAGSETSRSGISEITILNAEYGATPGRSRRTSGEASDRLRQALSGETIDW